MIDLSFLTDEEQESIRAVLRRDAELKKLEEQRIQNLQKKVNDGGQLRYLTGEWFYETKQLRHPERIHGSDIIRASMRHAHKPLTIVELCQLEEESSFVCSDSKEVFVPPVLCGLLQEPQPHAIHRGFLDQNPAETQQDAQKAALLSPKRRKNPFDCEPAAEELDSETLDGLTGQTRTGSQKTSTSSDVCVSCSTEPRRETNEGLLTEIASGSQLLCEETDSSGDRQALSISTTQQDTNTSLHSPPAPHPPPVDWRHRPGSPAPAQDEEEGPGLQELVEDTEEQQEPRDTEDGFLEQSVEEQQEDLSGEYEPYLQEQQAGEHTPSDDVSELCDWELLSPAVSSCVSTREDSGRPLYLETPEEDHQSPATVEPSSQSVEGSDTKLSPPGTLESFSHFVSPKPRRELAETQNEAEGPANTTLVKAEGSAEEDKAPKRTEVRTLQLTALQNTPFKDTMTSGDTDAQREETESRAGQVPDSLSDVKTHWERKNSSPTIIFTRDEAGYEDASETKTEISHNPQVDPDVIYTNQTPQMEMTGEDAAGRSMLADSSFFNLSPGDGTYRANPVLICEETDDSLTGSVTEIEMSEQQEDIISEDLGFPVPSPLSSTQPEERLVTISELKLFWEKEHSGPKTVTTRTEETSSSVSLSNTAASSQSDPRTSSNTRKGTKGEAQPSQAIQADVFRSVKLADKGLISPSNGGSQLRSIDDTTTVPMSRQAKADSESADRSFSPAKRPVVRPGHQTEEVRRSPSKTCHPKALPRESSSTEGSRLEDSPLKTFPIDINPQTRADEQQQQKPTAAQRQRRSPSQKVKQTMMSEPATDLSCAAGPARLNGSNTSTPPQPQKVPDSPSGAFSHLARSFIPQDYQHYLGPQEKAHIMPFDEEQEDSVEQRFTSSTSAEGNPSLVSSWIVRHKNKSSTTRAWSLPRESSGMKLVILNVGSTTSVSVKREGFGESTSPITSAPKPFSSTSKSSTKSLESLASPTSGEENLNDAREQKTQSVTDVSIPPPTTFAPSISEQLKTSLSVPVLQQDETDSDSTFEMVLFRRRTASSSTSNLSLSSGMASLSSVNGSLSSLFPVDGADVQVQGSVQFAVNYIQKLGEFHIFVVLCRGLAVADSRRARSDPYVKCYLLPDKSKLGKRKTSVKKKTLNPTYNEILRFKVLMEVLRTQSLNVSVWHNDLFGRNSFLGQVDLDLWDWDFSNTGINDYALRARVSAQLPASSLTDSRGQMRVALRFLPQISHSQRSPRVEAGEVQIWVKDCKNLPPVRGIVIDPFVKCSVLPDTSRKSRQKTRVVKRAANPMFNHTMVYDGFKPEDLREACAEITVWDHDRLNNHYIGGLRLGLGTGRSYGVPVAWMDSTSEEALLWQRMLQAAGDWVEEELPLRMLLMAKHMRE